MTERRAPYCITAAPGATEGRKTTTDTSAPSLRSQTLVLEGFPQPALARELSPNGRVHWARRAKARKSAAAVLHATAMRDGFRPATGPVRMTFRFIRPTLGRIDIDNLSTGVTKAVLDSLVRGGWLVDDDSTHVVAVTAEAVYEKGRRALVIVMEEAA